MSDYTNLVLGDIVLPLGSARGITQTLQPIDNGDVRRTVNGTLIDLTRVENRKFESNISATDMEFPAWSGLWKGDTITVECIEKLQQTVNPVGAAVSLIRDPVVASIVGRDANNVRVDVDTVGGVGNRDITFVSPIAYVEFRPILEMMILAKSMSRDEHGAEESWSIDLEEV